MFKRNQVAILLAGLLFVFLSAAVAQDCGCNQTRVKKKQEQPYPFLNALEMRSPGRNVAQGPAGAPAN